MYSSLAGGIATVLMFNHILVLVCAVTVQSGLLLYHLQGQAKYIRNATRRKIYAICCAASAATSPPEPSTIVPYSVDMWTAGPLGHSVVGKQSEHNLNVICCGCGCLVLRLKIPSSPARGRVTCRSRLEDGPGCATAVVSIW